MVYLKYCVLVLLAFACFSCNTSSEDKGDETMAEAYTQEFHTYLDSIFDAYVDRNPMYQTYLGIKKDYGSWGDISDEKSLEERRISEANLEEIKNRFEFDKLSEQGKLSYRLFEYDVNMQKEGVDFKLYNYPVNQLFGLHSQVPSFLMNNHRIDSLSDAEAYISRLNGVVPMFDQLIKKLDAREGKGILPPKFVFPQVIDDCRNIISGYPFEGNGTNALWQDFSSKVEGLNLEGEKEKEILEKGKKALTESLGQAYRGLMEFMEEQEKKATTDAGVWKFPEGEGFYNYALKNNTTTNLSAEEIFNTGVEEVERIKREMEGIIKQVGFEGDIKSFYRFLNNDSRFYYENSDSGRAAYKEKAVEIIENMNGRLDDLFITKPKAGIIVKRVEPFREKSAAAAFYQSPAPDGSRPGIFYVNLYDMQNVPKYEMEALAYHEGIPGHHMQIAIAQELTGLPKFRQFGNYTAYAEGWGLYSELVPKEMGLYEDPYSDFGRLSMEMWRACRLVVDVGIHYKKWSREKAIEYLCANTPKTNEDCRKEIERYIVLPAQATSYKVGMLKILELREKAKASLGGAFDVREFHDVVLTRGAVPLDILEENVDQWIAMKKKEQ